MEYKYVTTDCTNPYRNLANEQLLMNYVTDSTAILFLWQNDNTIVIGKNQDVNKECRVDEFCSTGGRIARRRSGGGAVYHDMGNLNFSIICHETVVKECCYQDLLVKALQGFNIKVEHNSRNDLTVHGRKFSGNAAYSDGEVVCQHGTILISVDIKKMAYFLTPEQSKLDRNHVSSVSSRVINLCQLSDRVSVEAVKMSMIHTVKAVELTIAPGEQKIGRLAMSYENREWIYGGV